MATSRTPGTCSSGPLPNGQSQFQQNVSGQVSPAPVSPEQIASRCQALLAHPHVSALLRALGADADVHVVGGSVRECAYDQIPHDLDLASRLTPQEVVARCHAAQIRVVETGMKHGTVTVVLPDMHVEVTTFRHAGPHHQNNFAESIEEDLRGRDFTINAMAVSARSGRFIDSTGGLADLTSGVVRCVGEPSERFSEDPLRLMRMIRFGQAADRAVEHRTEQACEQLAHRIGEVSPERVREELRRILLAEHPAAGIRALRDCGLLVEIAPELVMMTGVDQNEFHTEDVFDHTMSVLERCPADEGLRLAALFHDSGKPATISTGKDGRRHFYEHEVISARIARTVMERLRFSNEQTDRVAKLVRLHMRPIECGPAGVRRILRDVAPFYDDWRTFKYADSPPVMSEEEVQAGLAQFDNMVRAEQDRVARQGSGLAIGGKDLIQIGFEPGVAMGEFLRGCEELVIENPELNTQDELLRRAREHLAASKGSVVSSRGRRT